MISLELSSIQQNNAARAELAAATEAFLKSGGRILEAPISTPPIHNNFAKRMMADMVQTPRARDRAREEREQVRKLAKTMTRDQVCVEMGIGRKRLWAIAQLDNIEFVPAPKQQIDRSRDTELIERIKSYMELGVSRRKCISAMQIGLETFRRIIKENGIDYPKARNRYQ